MGLRRRYLFTRNDRLRLRYALPIAATFMMAGFSMSTVSLGFVSFEWPSFTSNKAYASRVAGDEGGQGSSSHFANADDTLISEGIRQAAMAMKKPERPRFYEVAVSKGGTIAGAMQEVGVNGADAYYVVEALSEFFDPRKVRAGQEIALHVDPVGDSDIHFEKMVFKIDPIQDVIISKVDEDKFEAKLEKKKLVEKTYARLVKIQTSLYGSAEQAGIPAPIIAEVIRAYSWDVDFQRDIRQGDMVKVLYNVQETEDGQFASYGDMSFASLTVGGEEKPIFRYQMKDGRIDYFQADGRSIKKTLMRTPIDGARLSSGFGMRKHPILGYNKMHKGVDFAASTGTPIYAAGDGVVEFAGNNGAYGNYVRIRHNGQLKTAYAHMHRLGKGVNSGKRVEQGQIIGYVGTTGRSTGPHLHYEVLLNNAQVNPNRVDLPVGEALAGAELDRFKTMRASIEQEYAALSGNLKVASRQSSDDTANLRP
jgi:murein DD-endopeptidase MepM/ murein hydrolase activator NlpD